MPPTCPHRHTRRRGHARPRTRDGKAWRCSARPERCAQAPIKASPGGIARSLCETALQWAFTRLNLVRVQAVVLETNLRSARTLERSGFQREGYLRSYRQVRGRSGNFWMYSRLR
ncbi:GNAT family N-acetyltransferase [Massilia sp. 9096]|uniref:GNAT family N-acetyltransferase n=1 Tax=Massilia sp. 9096 TaxID=1500894 RepID=UPI00068C8F41|nr:GNAT family protein [Massilia sp. 9096]